MSRTICNLFLIVVIEDRGLCESATRFENQLTPMGRRMNLYLRQMQALGPKTGPREAEPQYGPIRWRSQIEFEDKSANIENQHRHDENRFC